MNYPCLTVNIEKIYENTKEIVKRCQKINVSVTAITKCTGGNIKVGEAFYKAGACALGDSRLKNLEALKSIPIPKWLIRIPMISETQQAILDSDLSLNSEIKVLESLNFWAKKENKKHQVILMIDHGDLREGWFNLKEFENDLKQIKNYKNLIIKGIGTNSNCAGAIIPEINSFSNFPLILNLLKENFNLTNPIVSGGNSGAYYMVEDNTLPSFINNLRLGELLLLGNETSYGKAYSYLNQDAFILEAEIVEIKNKPSYPIGKIGKDAFGKQPKFIDKGIRKRAILAIGKQDINPAEIKSLDTNLEIITASSDHLIIDITNAKKNYQIGDILKFKVNYASALSSSVSSYVNKNFI